MASERNVIVHIRWFLAHFDLWPRWFDPPLFLRHRKSLLRFGLRSVKYSADRIKEIYDFSYVLLRHQRHPTLPWQAQRNGRSACDSRNENPGEEMHRRNGQGR